MAKIIVYGFQNGTLGPSPNYAQNAYERLMPMWHHACTVLNEASAPSASDITTYLVLLTLPPVIITLRAPDLRL